MSDYKYFCINYKHKTYKEKRIYARSSEDAWNKFKNQYSHEAPSDKRTDYIIL